MFYSQFGEDRILALIFTHRGACVEVGANNGVDGSTTLFFEQKGWECVLIEPNPTLCRELRANRAAQVFECAASGSDGVSTLQVAVGADLAHQVSALGDAESAARILTQHGFATRAIDVPTRRLDDILEEARLRLPIDFISIDVEGHELQLLDGFSPERWRPRILIIEDNSSRWRSEVSRRMRDSGYVRFRRTGVNDWYASEADRRFGTPGHRLAYWPSMLKARGLMSTFRLVDRLRQFPGIDKLWRLVRAGA
jgi:FkbM family methyltransferase